MPLNVRDLETYRRDERLGHKLLTPEERARLLKVCSSEEPLPLPVSLPSYPMPMPMPMPMFESSLSYL